MPDVPLFCCLEQGLHIEHLLVNIPISKDGLSNNKATVFLNTCRVAKPMSRIIQGRSPVLSWYRNRRIEWIEVARRNTKHDSSSIHRRLYK
jgi:hypothetical protein